MVRQTMLDNAMGDLFEQEAQPRWLAPGALHLPGGIERLGPGARWLLAWIVTTSAQAPFRHLQTPGGQRMSVAMTNAGPCGWVSDRRGYRYSPLDPLSQLPWPPLPSELLILARHAAEAAGFVDFEPDACLINRYVPGARMSLHQDRDEADVAHPIVSLSLGLAAEFLLGGLTRGDTVQRQTLRSGDLLVLGGEARLRFHGVAPVKAGPEAVRFNLTLRRAR
ncbi:DNA oxidative demethylase AlkB [Aeromonas molluscorum]|uniref:DNA oxidative demethylase AlkB n=1 Tax=Aeromonas molluscorum TaxID=271417 RepID=UPI003F1D49CB